MTLPQTSLHSESQQPRRKTWLSVSIVLSVAFSIAELVALGQGGKQAWWVILPVLIAALVAYWLNATGRQIPGSIVLLLALNLQFLLVLWARNGLSSMNAATSLGLAAVICVATLPRQYFGRVLMSALVTAIAAFFIDLLGISGGQQSELNIGAWVFLFVTLGIFAGFSFRDFLTWDIRTKIVTGILGIGALALAVFIFFALNRIQQLTNVLQGRLNSNISQLTEEKLRNAVSSQADQANQSFAEVMTQVSGLAQSWSALQTNKQIISQRNYWDASTNLIQKPGGQYGNSPQATSAVYVPAGVPVDEALVTDLNASAYLDFYVPGIMKANPSLIAMYGADTRGVLRYYPNSDRFAETLGPDFDVTQRPYYLITEPSANPERLPRWALPYEDAMGAGLVVTVAAPVYNNDQFTGIVAADMKLSGLQEQIAGIQSGQTGFAFLIDDAGHILYMPDAGLDLFDIPLDARNTAEFFKQPILGMGNAELQTATHHMVDGYSELMVADVNGDRIYIAYAPIRANGYSLAIVVPVSELQSEILAARLETRQQYQTASQQAAAILILLFLVAIAVSLGLGQVIAAPIQRLTHVATQVAAGDLSVQAPATTKDEIGTLAQSFNTMTARLRETLDGLERMVAARTAELLSANERNEHRAKQFESIAQVARTLSSTRDLDALLTQITTVISREFGFYHVGIFLLDAAKEYAILSATNSEGGRAMLKRGHRLKVGETGIVGYVTGTGKPRVALDVGADAVFFNSPDLPETRSEIALPLRTGDEIIGALDVQSTEPGAFSQDDINILSTLADQVSVAIQNARQFEQTRNALSEAEALAKQFARTGWQRYTADKNLVGIHHTGARVTLLYDNNGKEKQEEIWDTDPNQAKTRGAFLSLPIELRGEVIGSVNVRSPDSRPWDQDELDIVTAIIERAAIAMENARLLEESQRLASKEAKIGAVTAKISSSINMRNVLQTAVEELGRALPGSEVVIQFQADQNKTTS